MADYAAKFLTSPDTFKGKEGVGSASATYYTQRVWGSGNAAWCYYTKTEIDASPLSGETTPNWSGSISNHSVVSVRVG